MRIEIASKATTYRKSQTWRLYNLVKDNLENHLSRSAELSIPKVIIEMIIKHRLESSLLPNQNKCKVLCITSKLKLKLSLI